MKTEIKSICVHPRTYPYLAVYTGDSTKVLSIEELSKIEPKDISVISLLSNGGVHVQKLLGNQESFITVDDSFYYPLPTGTVITITQQ